MTNNQASKVAQQIVEIIADKSVVVKLEEIVNSIDDAANRTIDLIESSMPLTEVLTKNCSHISKQLSKNKIKDIESDLVVFLDNLTNNLYLVHNSLEEIMLAQKNQYASAMIANKFIDDLKNIDLKLTELIESCDKQVQCVANVN
jgi:chemotaxis protein CheZ